MIFSIIIDHRFRQNFIFRIAFGLLQMFIHKCGYLIHVKIDIRQFGCCNGMLIFDMLYKFIDNALDGSCFIHNIHTPNYV